MAEFLRYYIFSVGDFSNVGFVDGWGSATLLGHSSYVRGVQSQVCVRLDPPKPTSEHIKHHCVTRLGSMAQCPQIWLHFNWDQLGTNMVWIMTIQPCSALLPANQSCSHFKTHPLWSHNTIKTVPNFDYVEPGYWDIDTQISIDMWLLFTSVC